MSNKYLNCKNIADEFFKNSCKYNGIEIYLIYDMLVFDESAQSYRLLYQEYDIKCKSSPLPKCMPFLNVYSHTRSVKCQPGELYRIENFAILGAHDKEGCNRIVKRGFFLSAERNWGKSRSETVLISTVKIENTATLIQDYCIRTNGLIYRTFCESSDLICHP